MRTLSTSVLMVLLLSACGLKAPLYLPQEQPPPRSQPSQAEDDNK